MKKYKEVKVIEYEEIMKELEFHIETVKQNSLR